MHHFAQNIHSYVMCEVLDTSRAKRSQGSCYIQKAGLLSNLRNMF